MPLFPSVHVFFKQWLTGWAYYESLTGCQSPCLPLKRNSSQMHPTRDGVHTGAPCQQEASGPTPSSVLLSLQPAGTEGSLPGASTVSSLSPRTACSSEHTKVACHITGRRGLGVLGSPSPSLGCMVSPSRGSVCN